MFRLFFFTPLFAFAALFAKENAANKASNPFETFTAKVSGTKVRMRSRPDLDASIIRELKKEDHLLVVGEEGGFWKVAPPQDMKAYLFRTYVLDGVVEADRVNVRLEPNVDSFVLTQLQSGDKVDAKPCKEHAKWLEMPLPKDTGFYVAKEYLRCVGDGNYLSMIQAKKQEVEKLLNSAFFLTEKECKKPYHEMQPQNAIAQFEAIIQSYSDFPEHVKQAKEGLALIQDNYLQKKLSILEEKKELTAKEKEELFAGMQQIEKNKSEKKQQLASDNEKRAPLLMDSSCYWQQQEKKLYNQWKAYNPSKNPEQYYAEQKVNAKSVRGILTPFSASINKKPGDYLLIDPISNKKIAFIYSTQVDLQEHIGKEVSMKVSKRPNHQFAYPALFVHTINK